jgi:hypothetical protein
MAGDGVRVRVSLCDRGERELIADEILTAARIHRDGHCTSSRSSVDSTRTTL